MPLGWARKFSPGGFSPWFVLTSLGPSPSSSLHADTLLRKPAVKQDFPCQLASMPRNVPRHTGFTSRDVASEEEIQTGLWV